MQPTLGILHMELAPLTVVFWATELLVHVVGFVISAVFLLSFFRFPLFHANFRLIIANLALSTVFTSVSRFAILVGHIARLIPPESPAGDWLQTLRDTGMYSAGFHLVLLSGERAIATIKSRVYEKSRGFHLVVALILATWLGSFLIIFFTRRGELSQFVALGIIAVADGVAFLVMLVFFYVNHKMYFKVTAKVNGGVPQSLSQRYQYSENISSSRLLIRFLLFLAVASLVALASFLGYLFYGDRSTLGRVFGFVFDLTIASLTSFVPIIIIIGTPRLRSTTLDRICATGSRFPKKKAEALKDINGRKLIVKDETKVYFDQLKASWY
ncbi:hypothetical protein QR680_013428 [Steinernema hermaphroditum]|uniref:G-protein coupled receptors family 1 profile domain-containing protein n=1 Tax=Steinernema hermaphroditum TaxID=289476 RepID=A0AA39I843_9BILA|nr:hypothetical protein QR680_013428 [Steinernema hermaphroditum]